ncbi:epoxyqueuosine reductase [Thermodesulfobacteriota bacterium]
MKLNKEEVIEQAYKVGLMDIGFTTAEKFTSQKEILDSRRESYEWTYKAGWPVLEGTDPKTFLENAKSIIVIVEPYFSEAFPPSMVGKFGRCYQDDDRITKDGFVPRLISFLKYLGANGIKSKLPFHLPHRLSAARAGLGTFGKNNFFYSNKLARKSSWVLPVPIIVDHEFSPDEPTIEVGCPKWCKNACIAACPTGALSSPNKIEPRKCISYLSYYGEDIPTPEVREQMGMWVYGCDRCQDVCPRNQSWLTQELPVNERVAAKEKHFSLPKLLHMDRQYYESNVFPHMFYTPADDLWRWHMNVARSMGNSLDAEYVPDLIHGFQENGDERVKSMCAWALGRIGGKQAKVALEGFREQSEGRVQEEVKRAIEKITN